MENKKNDEVQEQAFLLYSDEYVGVTNNVGDLVQIIQKNSELGKKYMIYTGYKDELLNYQYKLLWHDIMMKAIAEDETKFKKIKKFSEYNLAKREECPIKKWQDLLER